MADPPPFGFGPPGGAGRGSGSSSGSGSSGSGSSGDDSPSPLGPLGDPQQFADALRQFADLMSWQGGPVNWDLAKNVARHAVAAEGDPSVLDVDRQKIIDALRLADLWLDEVTGFPTGVRQAQAWSKSEWVEATLPVWSQLCDPIADKAVDAMGGILAEDPSELGAGLPEELGQALQAIGGGLSGHRVPCHVFGEVPVHRAALRQFADLMSWQGVSELLRVTERPKRARGATLAM